MYFSETIKIFVLQSLLILFGFHSVKKHENNPGVAHIQEETHFIVYFLLTTKYLTLCLFSINKQITLLRIT